MSVFEVISRDYSARSYRPDPVEAEKCTRFSKRVRLAPPPPTASRSNLSSFIRGVKETEFADLRCALVCARPILIWDAGPAKGLGPPRRARTIAMSMFLSPWTT